MSANPDDSLPTRSSVLRRLKDDDEATWQEFYGTYRGLILNFVRRARLNEADAEEVLNDTMREVHKHLPGFDYRPERARFKTWLLTITRHRIIDFLRKDHRRPRTVSDDPCDERRTDLLERQPDPASLPGEAVWNEEWVKHRITLALKRLQPPLKNLAHEVAFQLFVNERTPREVAKLLGLPTARVFLIKFRTKSRLQSALQRLEEEL